MYDAILILGGSIHNDGSLPTWVISRLDKALEYDKVANYYIVLSRYTYHKVPLLKNDQFPLDESRVMGQYLLEKGVSSEKILLDTWSVDTIGNVYAALTMHCIPFELTNLLIITSDFHMPRSKAICEKIFSLYPYLNFKLSFAASSSDISISEKERKSLETWNKNKLKINSLKELHQFIFIEHNAYSLVKKYKDKQYPKEQMKMYCF